MVFRLFSSYLLLYLQKNRYMSSGKKSYIVVVIIVIKNTKFISSKNSPELSIRTHSVTVIDVGSLSF